MMQSSLMTEAPAVQPRRTTKTLFLALVGVSALCACLFHSGVLSAPVTGSSAAAEYVQSPLEQEVGQEIAAMASMAQRIMSDPKKVQLLARRIRELFQDAKFVEKMQMEMAKLQNDEELYAWLAMTQGAPQGPRRLAAAFQVQPSAFRGAPATRAPAAQMQFSLPQFGGNGGKPAKGKAFTPAEFAATLPGIIEPLGFFDPAGFCADDAGSILPQSKQLTEGRVRFYREAEVKHCRVAMLAAVGFPIAEQFHPLFGGNIDLPSYIAFQETPLQTFWPAVLVAIAVPEVLSIFTFQSPLMDTLTRTFGPEFESSFGPADRQPWAINVWKDREAGDFGWDPLGFKPKDPAALRDMQTKELNNGRLAMIGVIGLMAAENIPGSVPAMTGFMG